MSKQKDWDTLLINAWFKDKNISMAALGWRFKEMHGEWPNEAKVLRCHREPWQNKMKVVRFVAALIPKLSNVLFNSNPTRIASIIDALGRGNLDTGSTILDYGKSRRERTMFDKSAKDFAKQRLLMEIYREEKARDSGLTSAHGIRRARV